MSTGSNKPEWDTPAHGDFAAYVERLTAPKPISAASPPAAPGPASDLPVQPGAVAPPFDPKHALPKLMSGLRVARAFLLALTLVQAVALLVWGRGAWLGLLMAISLWWGLGRISAGAAVLQNRARLRPKGLGRAPEKSNS